MLAHVENDFGATALNLDLIKSAKIRAYDFDRVNRDIYEFTSTFDTNGFAGQSFNICEFNNASVYFGFDGLVSLLIRNNGLFEVAAKFDSTGESETDLDAVYCALSLSSANA